MVENLAEKVRGLLRKIPDKTQITCAASLAHHNLLGSVDRLRLQHVDLSSVPEAHLASLLSSVTKGVDIESIWPNVYCGRVLVNILDNVKSVELVISDQSLDSEETQALARAMDTRVSQVTLAGGVTLAMGVMTQSSGQGVCRMVTCYEDTATRYREELCAWAKTTGWEALAEEYMTRVQR